MSVLTRRRMVAIVRSMKNETSIGPLPDDNGKERNNPLYAAADHIASLYGDCHLQITRIMAIEENEEILVAFDESALDQPQALAALRAEMSKQTKPYSVRFEFRRPARLV